MIYPKLLLKMIHNTAPDNNQGCVTVAVAVVDRAMKDLTNSDPVIRVSAELFLGQWKGDEEDLRLWCDIGGDEAVKRCNQ